MYIYLTTILYFFMKQYIKWHQMYMCSSMSIIGSNVDTEYKISILVFVRTVDSFCMCFEFLIH